MATKFEEVYQLFYIKVNDFDIPLLTEETRDDFLYDLLRSAIVSFHRICQTDLLDRNEEDKEFNNTLTEEEIDILSEIMVEKWLKPKYNNSDLYLQSFSTKDISTFSNANLLNAIKESYTMAKENSNQMIVDYSYNVADFSELGK